MWKQRVKEYRNDSLFQASGEQKKNVINRNSLKSNAHISIADRTFTEIFFIVVLQYLTRHSP